jgi:ribosomal protein L22
MADEEKKDKKPPAEKPKPKPRGKAAAKPAAKSAESKSGAAKPRARKAAAKDEPKEGPKADAKAEAKAEAKPARKPARRAAAKKPAAEKPAKPAAKKPAAKKAPAAEREAPQRPLVRARAKYVRSSARKARLVMDHVRGHSVSEARALLRHSPRGVARDVERLLNSAVANAENNHDLVGDDLYVKEIYADEGPTLRRFRPRAQGRATRIRKRTSHLTVGLSTKE